MQGGAVRGHYLAKLGGIQDEEQGTEDTPVERQNQPTLLLT